MKIKYILLLSTIVLSGCMTTDIANMSLDSYIQKNGVPQYSYDLQNGNKLYFFQMRCTNSREYKEYNVEVTSDNIVVKETVTKSCPYVTRQNNYVSDNYSATPYHVDAYNLSLLQQRYDMLNARYLVLVQQQVSVSEQWMQSQRVKGVTHPDTIALKQQYDKLVERSKVLKEEMDKIKLQLE